MAQVAERCNRLDMAHSGVREVAGYGAGLDIPDPDGTVVRIVWKDAAAQDGFVAVEYDEDTARRPRTSLGG